MNFDWISAEYYPYFIALLATIRPFIPAKYMEYLGVLRVVFEVLAGNHGHAKNADDVKKK